MHSNCYSVFYQHNQNTEYANANNVFVAAAKGIFT